LTGTGERFIVPDFIAPNFITQNFVRQKTLSSQKCFVILSEAKDLLFRGKQQVLRFAQDDKS
jgi:hypothetical protein